MKAEAAIFAQWSEADALYVGTVRDQFIGGVCHGADEQKVYRELTKLVAEEIAEAHRAKRPLPKKTAQVMRPVGGVKSKNLSGLSSLD